MPFRHSAALLVAVAAPALAVPADFKAQADAIVAADVAADGPGAAVIVTRKGKVVYAAGRGIADIETKQEITPDTVFRLGSITKQFTAAAILKLVEQGKLSLDDPLTKFIPDYPPPGGAATVRQLLNHTSGIMPYTAIPTAMAEASTGRAYSTGELIATFKGSPPQFKPGEKYNYNNSGYVLLGAILEQLTGKRWDQAVHDIVLQPLKLSAIRGGVDEATTPRMAKGYTSQNGKVVPAMKIHMSVPHAAGALIGTVGELARWINALHHGRVLKPASYAAMIAPTRTADGQTEPYGFGIGTSDVRGKKVIGHSGGIFGFSTDSLYLPEQDLVVAAFVNTEDGASPGLIVRKLAAAAIGDSFPVFTVQRVEPAAIAPLLGVYKVGVNQRTFFERDGKYYTQRSGGGELEVFAAGGNRFFYGPRSLTWFEVVTAADGTRTMMMHHDGGLKAEEARWSGPVPAETPGFAVPGATLDSYAGTYVAEFGKFLIVRDGNKLTVKLNDQPTFPMKAISLTEFEIPAVGAKIRFSAGVGGKVDTLTLLQGGREMPAKRAD